MIDVDCLTFYNCTSCYIMITHNSTREIFKYNGGMPARTPAKALLRHFYGTSKALLRHF